MVWLRYVFLARLFVLAAALPGCDWEHHRLMKEQYPSYPEGVRRAIDRGNVMRGMNQDQVYLALGSPVCKKEIEDQGRLLQVWLYPPIGRDACITADFRVYFEEGTVVTWDRFKKPVRDTDPPGGAPQY
ncbi:MAG: hypothetical protein OJF47_000616 [Nitrospira sp.]|nr:MAG: hypothetical protein OJF47_000616 [Nitrospira sp.]